MIVKEVMKNASAVNSRAVVGFPTESTQWYSGFGTETLLAAANEYN